jgi:hypothetical protein
LRQEFKPSFASTAALFGPLLAIAISLLVFPGASTVTNLLSGAVFLMCALGLLLVIRLRVVTDRGAVSIRYVRKWFVFRDSETTWSEQLIKSTAVGNPRSLRFRTSETSRSISLDIFSRSDRLAIVQAVGESLHR